jgi:hypothetical protein
MVRRSPPKACRGSVRWFSLLVCVSILTSSTPLAIGADATRSPAAQIAAPAPIPHPAAAAVAADTAATEAAADQLPRPAGESASAPGDGVVLGLVINAEGGAPLGGVQVVASGVPEQSTPYRLYLPLVLRSFAAGASLALRTVQPLASSVVFTTTTAADGAFSLALPAGVFTLTLALANFVPDRRTADVRANETTRVADVRLHAADPVVTPIGSGGGTATNSLGNTSLAARQPTAWATPAWSSRPARSPAPSKRA